MFAQQAPGELELVPNRRTSTRYRASGRAQVREVGGNSWRWAMLCDMCLGGCYLEMPAPLAAGKEVEVNLTVSGIQLYLRAEVIGCQAYVGMALKFKPLTPANRARLEQVMEMLSRTQIPV